MTKIPTDPHIRNLLDGVDADDLAVVYRHLVQALDEAEVLKQFCVGRGYYLLALDGTLYFSSEKVHCQSCTTRLSKGKLRYGHSVIPPVLVSPKQSEVISLEPEFVLPQDGDERQDCERKAAKRWLNTKAHHYPLDKVIVLGDDLYCCQSHCEAVRARGWHFIFVCKPESHPTLYEYLDLQKGYCTASLFISKLQAYPRQHPIMRALQEYGRLEKTIHILRWYADPHTRKRVSKQLNKGEALHVLRKIIVFGKYGELPGLEDEALDQQFACLNLVTNAVIVFNTVHIARIAEELRAEGHEVNDEDLERVWPARHGHINFLGKYFFDAEKMQNA